MKRETSLTIQWLRFRAFKARGVGLIPDGGTTYGRKQRKTKDLLDESERGVKMLA